MLFKQDEKIVFIGDSITDDGHFRDSQGLGLSYVRLLHDYFQVRYPELDLNMINKGISGDQVTDLARRWDRDVIKEAPDWVFISIGINDVWRQIKGIEIRHIYPDEFERVYRELLMRVTEETDAKLIILEPTIIGENSKSEGNIRLQEYVKITQKLSKEFHAIHVPLHEIFTQYVDHHPENTLTKDGVHMIELGRMLMALSIRDVIEQES